MKPKILNKIKNDNYVMVLYSFGDGKDVTFFDIFTNNFTNKHKEELTNILSKVKNSGIVVLNNNEYKVNFIEGKEFKQSVRFVLYNKDVRKVYDDIKLLIEYGHN